MIFFYIVEKKTFNYKIQEKFQYFGNTIFYIFHKVFSSLLYLYAETVNLLIKDDVLYPQIANNIKYFSYF